MDFQFCIVGRKNTDCFVVHDARKGMGGKACASRYTIAQLIREGYAVRGVDCSVADGVKNGKNLTFKDITVTTLAGRMPKTVNSYPDIPSTKRNFSTFIKGIKPDCKKKHGAVWQE